MWERTLVFVEKTIIQKMFSDIHFEANYQQTQQPQTVQDL